MQQALHHTHCKPLGTAVPLAVPIVFRSCSICFSSIFKAPSNHIRVPPCRAKNSLLPYRSVPTWLTCEAGASHLCTLEPTITSISSRAVAAACCPVSGSAAAVLLSWCDGGSPGVTLGQVSPLYTCQPYVVMSRLHIYRVYVLYVSAVALEGIGMDMVLLGQFWSQQCFCCQFLCEVWR